MHADGYVQWESKLTTSGRRVRYRAGDDWHEFREHWDLEENVLERTLFDGSGQRWRDTPTGGVWWVVRQYVDGLRISEKFYDVADEPAEHLCGFFSREFAHDAVGRRTGQRFLGRDGRPSLKVVRYDESPDFGRFEDTVVYLSGDVDLSETRCGIGAREW